MTGWRQFNSHEWLFAVKPRGQKFSAANMIRDLFTTRRLKTEEKECQKKTQAQDLSGPSTDD